MLFYNRCLYYSFTYGGVISQYMDSQQPYTELGFSVVRSGFARFLKGFHPIRVVRQAFCVNVLFKTTLCYIIQQFDSEPKVQALSYEGLDCRFKNYLSTSRNPKISTKQPLTLSCYTIFEPTIAGAAERERAHLNLKT